MNSGCTVQDIFHRFYPDYEKSHAISAIQRKAAYHIMSCKTGAFGVNISVCEDCGCVSIHYNSCRDRCCPMCQEFPKEKWVDARREDVLDAPYFHVVFTVPEELNPVIYSNQKLLYDALYHAASDTLNELASDKKHLGADIGYICILHTWGSHIRGRIHPKISDARPTKAFCTDKALRIAFFPKKRQEDYPVPQPSWLQEIYLPAQRIGRTRNHKTLVQQRRLSVLFLRGKNHSLAGRPALRHTQTASDLLTVYK